LLVLGVLLTKQNFSVIDFEFNLIKYYYLMELQGKKANPATRNGRDRFRGGVKREMKIKPTAMEIKQMVKSTRKQKQIVPINQVSTNATSIMKVDVLLDPVAFQMPFISFYSFLTSDSSIIQYINNTSATNPYQFIASGVVYLYEQLSLYLQSGTPTPTRLPLVFLDFIAGMLPKLVRTRAGGSIGYAWSIETFPTLPTLNEGGFSWTFQEPATDVGSYASPSVAVTPAASADAYTKILQLLDARNFKGLGVVDNVVKNSRLANSVSAFARCYVYNGLYPSNGLNASGCYKDIELEVPIYNPIMAQFAPYGSDSRVPRYLSIGTGDACAVFGLPMHQRWGGYQNAGHVIYKFIDFEDIYSVLGLWAAKCKESLQSNTDAGYNSNLYCQPFTFTQQDFRVMLRQALLAFFAEGYWTQFTGPIINESANWFQPFYVTGNTYPNSSFLRMMLPQLLQENLAALKYRVIESANSKYRTVVVPVLGRYVADTPSVIQYSLITFSGETEPTTTPTPLFNNLVQNVIQLTDGTSAGGFVNLNGTYYDKVMNNWNQFVTAAQRVSTETVNLTCDNGPVGLRALTMTRAVAPINGSASKLVFEPDKLQLDERFSRRDSKGKLNLSVPPAPILLADVDKYVVNSPNRKNNTNVKAIIPSSAMLLQPLLISSITSFSQTEYGLIQNLILPTIRFDETSLQILTAPKYQTEVLEFNSNQILGEGTEISTPNGWSSLLEVWETYATMMIKGAGGTESQYASIMRLLGDNGHAGFLSSILGGLAKTILPPEAHGIIDGIADAVPF